MNQTCESNPCSRVEGVISVVVPCFNEEPVLGELLTRVRDAADSSGHPWEVVLVDDGSRDATWPILEAQCRNDRRFRAISFSRNFGHQAAVSAGLRHAQGDAVVVMDADLQDPPELIQHMIERWLQGHDVVNAVRRERKESRLRNLSCWFYYRLLRRSVPFQMAVDSGDFCLMDRRVVDVINGLPERQRYVRGLRAWAGFSHAEFEYERRPRAAGRGKYDFRRLLRLALDGLLPFSDVPVRFVSLLGLAIVGLTLCGFLFHAGTALLGVSVDGAPTLLALSLCLLGGVQLLGLGVVGEILSRVYQQVLGRPDWIVKADTSTSLRAAESTPAPRQRSFDRPRRVLS